VFQFTKFGGGGFSKFFSNRLGKPRLLIDLSLALGPAFVKNFGARGDVVVYFHRSLTASGHKHCVPPFPLAINNVTPLQTETAEYI
jgi:hypothetical protein